MDEGKRKGKKKEGEWKRGTKRFGRWDFDFVKRIYGQKEKPIKIQIFSWHVSRICRWSRRNDLREENYNL